MARKRVSGLINRKGIWHVDKVVRGRRICESTGESEIEKAEEYLAHRVEELRQASIFGVRPKRTFKEAATKYLNETTKASAKDAAWCIEQVEDFVGNLPLEHVHMGTLQPFIDDRRAKGWKSRSINYPLQTVRHILNLCARVWLDENGLSWMVVAPKIKLLPQKDARKPYPLSWDEQTRLFEQLPRHLQKMALFKVNTGCREAEVCGLKWEYEIDVPELGTSVFVIPEEHVKNRQERLVVLNKVAKSVIEDMRGDHPEYVFTFKGRPVPRMLNTAWRKARQRSRLEHVRVHDLKHTFGRRLRAAGVSFEDRQDLLGHKSGRMTTHYSKAELVNLINASNMVCGDESRKSPALIILKKKNLALVSSNQAR